MNVASCLLRPWTALLLLLPIAVGCGASGDASTNGGNPADGGKLPDGADATTPTVISNEPLNAAAGVALNASISATFSEAMNPATLDATTFTVVAGATATPVQGTVLYANSKVTFWPAAHLADSATFTATVTTGARSAYGVALGSNHAWSFTTGNSVAQELPVNLGTAASYVILAKSGISTVPTSAITGSIGVSPAAASFITGFSLTADSSSAYSTSSQVVGKIFAADDAPPTPSNLTAAVNDMELAFTNATKRAPGVTELGAGNIGGMTLAAGVYRWGTGLLIPTDVTLSGSGTDVWILQIAQDLTIASAVKTVLTGGALPKNVFWQVSGSVDLGTTCHLEGVVLSQTAITLETGASVTGRLLAQTAVNIDASTVVHA